MKAVIGAYNDTIFSRLYCLNNYYTNDICQLLISGVGVNIVTDILCESDGRHCKLS